MNEITSEQNLEEENMRHFVGIKSNNSAERRLNRTAGTFYIYRRNKTQVKYYVQRVARLSVLLFTTNNNFCGLFVMSSLPLHTGTLTKLKKQQKRLIIM